MFAFRNSNRWIAALAGVLIAAWAAADTIRLPRDRVVPIRFEKDVLLKGAKVGDPVIAKSDNARELPAGSELQGEITSIRHSTSKRKGFVEIAFRSVLLPDGTRAAINALPIALDSKSVARGEDGRFEIAKRKEDASKTVGGSILAGLILGNSIKKPLEGALIGALAGIAIAEIEKDDSGRELALSKNKRYGAVLVEDFVLETGSRAGAAENRDALDPIPAGERRDRVEDDSRRTGRRDAPEVLFNGRPLQFRPGEAPYWESDVCMVPLEEASRQLDVELTVSRSGQRFYLDGRNATVSVELGTRIYRLNGRSGDLKFQVVRVRETVFVPVEVLEMASGGALKIAGTKSAK